MTDSKEKLLADINSYKPSKYIYVNSSNLYDFIDRGIALGLLPKTYRDEGIEMPSDIDSADESIHRALDKLRDIVSGKNMQWKIDLHYGSGVPAQLGGARKSRRGRKHRKGSRKAHCSRRHRKSARRA